MNIQQVRDILIQYQGKDMSELFECYELNNNGNKGRFGHLIEKVLGLDINSKQEPDFDDFELKCVPLRKLKNGKYSFKETVAVTMINPKEIINTKFENSHLYNKLNRVLFVTYINNTIEGVYTFELKGEVSDIIKKDYELVQNTLISGGVLTSKMGQYIQPRTKGAGHGSTSRAFYGRTKFLNRVIFGV